MSTRNIFLLIAAIVVGLWWWFFPSATVRYRLAYEVEVDGKLHSGSSVVQSGLYAGPFCGGIHSYAPCWSFTGEAAVVDLGARGMLFALLAGPEPNRSVDHVNFNLLQGLLQRTKIVPRSGVWLYRGPHGGRVAAPWLYMAGLRTTHELTRDEMQLLVRFRDPTDPTTAEVVDPADMAKSFGPGVRFVRATITFVDPGWWPMNYLGAFGVPFAHWFGGGEPVTRGIEGRVPITMAKLRELDTGPMAGRLAKYGEFKLNSGHLAVP